MSARKSKVVVFTEKGKVELHNDAEIPSPGEGMVLLRTKYTGICAGTELSILHGHLPGFEFPLIPGYENVSEVIECGPGVDCKLGKRFFGAAAPATKNYKSTWGGQSEYTLGNVNYLQEIPDDLGDEEAVFIALTSIAWRGISQLGIKPGEWVAVLGQGTVGNLALQVARYLGARTIAVDKFDFRLKHSKAVGADFLVNASEADPAERVKEITNGGSDVTVDAVPNTWATMKLALKLIRKRRREIDNDPTPRCLLMGSKDSPDMELTYEDIAGEKAIYCTEDRTTHDQKKAVEILQAGKINVKDIITVVIKPEETVDAYRLLTEEPNKYMRILVNWRD